MDYDQVIMLIGLVFVACEMGYKIAKDIHSK